MVQGLGFEFNFIRYIKAFNKCYFTLFSTKQFVIPPLQMTPTYKPKMLMYHAIMIYKTIRFIISQNQS